MKEVDVDAPVTEPEVVPGKPGGLGTFGGVFTPSILTILGVIMYLRFGWVVGNVGLLGTLLVVTLATSITFLTALSVAAIATDQRVRIGGAYYMISRSLGIETGGAVGIPLFLAQGLSVALYTVGFAESVARTYPMLDERAVGMVTTVAIAGVALVSAKVAIRSQYVILAAIAVSLLSFLFGRAVEPTDIEMWGAADRHSEGFWVVFAVFFPAVTGIMAGVNMSGDLRNPAKSIPRGTFWAVGTGYVIYMTLPVILAMRADALTLIEDPLIMRRIAFWGDAILLGVWGATLSSAMGSILGAPRVLQALARDGVLPRPLKWLGRGSGSEDLPRAGTVFTLGLALVAVWLGDLNMIAPILTMFFLTTYAVLNIAAGVEGFLKSPSFRPRFKVHWSLSALGAAGCVSVMLLINGPATLAAAVIVGGIYAWLERRSLEGTWGDVRHGLWMAITRFGLLRLTSAPDPKSWRPHVLVLSGAPMRRWHLVELAAELGHHGSLMTVATVLPAAQVSAERQAGFERRIQRYLVRWGVQAFVRVVGADDPFTGSRELVRMYGLGSLVPNTILLGNSARTETFEDYCAMVDAFYRGERNVLIVKGDEARPFGDRQRIDIWWGGLKGNGGLMMIMGYLLGSSIPWRQAEVRVKMVVADDDAATAARRNLTSIVQQIRTNAVPEVLVAHGRPFPEILRESSADADLVLMGMAEPADPESFTRYYARIQHWIEPLHTVVLVLAAQGTPFGEVLVQGDVTRRQES
ncbi:MAG TPA: amino acid permease [Longimicrobiales bacterium]|nr:amino acid permease [Longimicrobiales bacterium]